MTRDAVLSPLIQADIPFIGPFAQRIWREYYASIIGADQIEHMLRARYDEADLKPYIDASDRSFDVLRLASVIAGFLRCRRLDARTLKIEEIYLDAPHRGAGLGALMLDHAQTRARNWDLKSLTLFVNKRNDAAVRAYLRNGFTICDSIVTDIGNGFVMDDFQMAKQLTPPSH